MQDEMAKPASEKEWRLLEKLVMSSVLEQRRARRWGIFFKALTFVYLFVILVVFSGPIEHAGDGSGKPHTAIIEVAGVIAAEEAASADNIVTALRDAFDEANAKAVILRINSPGGSPVQAGYIYDEIKRLKALKPEKRVYAVIADIGASGGYYIAAAADAIYADKASLVGSIGVTAAGFGFVDAIEKLGVERRNYTSGEHKSFLDPFMPEKPEEVAIWKNVLDSTHKQFIRQVEDGRGDRLKKDEPLLYSGVVWSGEQALPLGLIDGLGSSGYVAREIVGVEDLVDYTLRENPFEALVSRLGASVGRQVAQSVLHAYPELR
ncbi:MAG: S49 family peptidase [Hahellaceae bacterium]|nr:S49 family peptidase [Hahellaceae bacterium]